MSKPLSKHIRSRLDKLLGGEIDMALRRRARRVVEELDPQNGDKILEAGCGPGYYLRILSKLGLNLKLYGIDIDRNALTSAKKIIGKRAIYASLTKKLPFKANSFDKVFTSEVLEHIQNDNLAMDQIYKVLKPGGRLVITVPNNDYPFFWDPVNWVMERILKKHIRKGLWAGIWSNHIRLYSVEEIKRLVKKGDFSVVDIEPLTWWSLPFNQNILYGGKLKLLPNGLSKAISKQMGSDSLLRRVILEILSLNDKLNDIVKFRKIGVGILVVARK
jgi:ubiquinone/menaquinone biosynthesis C-methylase UbiE